jgi:hypothetical protein
MCISFREDMIFGAGKRAFQGSLVIFGRDQRVTTHIEALIAT